MSDDDSDELVCHVCGKKYVGIKHWYHMADHNLCVDGPWCCFCGEDLGFCFDGDAYVEHMRTCTAYAAALLAGEFIGEYKDGRPVR